MTERICHPLEAVSLVVGEPKAPATDHCAGGRAMSRRASINEIREGESLFEAASRLGVGADDLEQAIFDLAEADGVRLMLDELGWLVERPADAVCAFAKIRRERTTRLRAERKAEREARQQHIEEMESRGYEVAGSEPGGKLTWTKKGSEAAQPENVTPLKAWRAKHAR
jgi:hypothetical protein